MHRHNLNNSKGPSIKCSLALTLYNKITDNNTV